MESTGIFYPLRTLIRGMAKEQLTISSEAYVTQLCWDEKLFDDLAATFLNPNIKAILTSPCRSRESAHMIEESVAKELAEAYKHIIRQRDDELVQRLNALL